MQLNPALTQMQTYPFVALDRARCRTLAAGRQLIVFSFGNPHEATGAAICAAMCEAIEERSRYPKGEGLPAGHTSEAFAVGLLENGVAVAPGSCFGEAGEGCFRLARVPTIEECRRAVATLEEVL